MSVDKKLMRANADILRVVKGAVEGKLQDPNVVGVTVLDVSTTNDFSECKVFVEIMGSASEQQKVLEALQNASGFVRTEISAGVALKNTPRVRFVLDKGRENANRVEELLAQINNTE